MASSVEMSDQFINQMLKGITGVYPKEYANENVRRAFLQKHRNKVLPLVPFIPRYNAAIGAVILKCAIRYGLYKSLQFTKAVRDGTFNGPNDPAHKLWLYLARNKNFKSTDVYKIATSAARAYCEGRTLMDLRPAGKDILVWNPLWEEGLERIERELEGIN